MGQWERLGWRRTHETLAVDLFEEDLRGVGEETALVAGWEAIVESAVGAGEASDGGVWAGVWSYSGDWVGWRVGDLLGLLEFERKPAHVDDFGVRA